MPRKSRTSTIDDTAPLRLEAAQKFAVGDRVCHQTTNKTGNFIGICDNVFALPEVWVSWDETENEWQKTYSCNPLELELVERRNTEIQAVQESEPTALGSPEAQLKLEPTALGPPLQVEPELEVTTLVVCEELTNDELADRQRLELKVERAFYEAGAALRELRDRRLYRTNYGTFEQYCRDRFGMAQSAAYYLIAAALVMDNLISKCPQIVEVFPTRESQCRELAKLDMEEQPLAWIESLNRTGGKKVPSATIVRGVVTEIKERSATPPPMPYCKDDVVTIRGMGNPDLRRHDGQWAIVLGVNEYTVSVSLDGKDISVKPQFLEQVDPKNWTDIKAVHHRISRLQECDLDPVDDAVLEVLMRRTCFTERQKAVLSRLEKDYGLTVK